MSKRSGEIEKSKSKSLLKSFMVYLFLLYSAFLISDLAILKFVKPQFMVTVNAKDRVNRINTQELETQEFSIGDLGTKDFFTSKIIERNIFNSKEMPAPIASLSATDEHEAEEDQEPVPSTLSLALEGTVVHRNPFRSLATITNADKTLSFTVGDQIENMAEVISVIRKKVIIRNLRNKKLEYIEISRDRFEPKPRVARRKPRTTKPPESKGSDLIKRDGNRFTARRADVNAQLNNIASLSRQANSRLARDPATGEILGYQVFDIKPGLLQNLGVQDNDIISSVNGMEIKNPLQASSAFSKLKAASEITVMVNRGGRMVELEYIIE